MGTLYRVVSKVTGESIGDFIIESNDAVLLSSTHELITTENLAQSLPDLKVYYISEINKKAGQVRLRFITLEPGQETTYARKTQESINYLQAIDPIDADYPYLINEATATDMTMYDLATSVLANVRAMDVLNVIIEAQRKRGIKQVSESITEADAKAARDFAISSLDEHGA